MRLQPIAYTWALVAVTSGCGGADGERRTQAVQPVKPREVKLECGTTNSLNCTQPATVAPDGHLTTFSYAEAAGGTRWCNAAGFHGSTFTYNGVTDNTKTLTFDPDQENLALEVMVSTGSYAGGGLAFESCLDASAFTGIQFTIAVSSGSLTGCNYEFQLQTFEQRPTTPAPGGACDQKTTSCYNFPAARNLPAPSTDPTKPTLVTLPFTSFTGMMMPAPPQLVGLQWQVSSTSGACELELRIDDVDFIPAAQPTDADSD